MMFHIPTAFFIIGLLYLFLPIIVWLVLKHQASHTVSLWCLGGGVLAVGLLFISQRQFLPLWVTYTVANVFAWSGILMQATALRHALKKQWHVKWLALIVVLWAIVFDYFRVVLQSQDYRFAWSMTLYVMVFLYIAYLAWQISTEQDLRSGRWLAVVYVVAAIALILRIGRVMLDMTEPDVVADGVDSILTVVSGLLISVIGSFTFVSMFLERSAKRDLIDVENRARQQESARLADQIAQLERQRTLGAMSYAFAHELSQPLTALLMDTQSIKTSLQSPVLNLEDVTDSIHEIEKSANRTVALIEGIRNFIRPTKGMHELVDLKLLVHDVQLLLAHDIRKQNVTFQWDFDAAECLVRGDKVQLSQIVLNVYRNAVQAMAYSDVRTIHVALEREEHHVVLRVHDSGPGLNEDKRDQLGQPFVTTKAEGLGVGLSISTTIAEMHGGSFSITNAVGGGALVELNLPAA
ncbi:hypothetical protein LMORI2_04430 [Limnohabitans sp. MORI2]|nr:hypothetical protein LMORI2_04430 [Limnohabitans sp. MORI2]